MHYILMNNYFKIKLKQDLSHKEYKIMYHINLMIQSERSSNI